jgi:AraC-like DNA-binding protein
MDVLSEVLKVVTLQGAVFYNAEFSAPWGFRAPASRKVAPYFSPGGGHVIIFHLLTEGRGEAALEDGEPVPLEAGDIVVFPHGHPHIIENGSPKTRRDNEKELQQILAQGLKLARMGGGGEVTKFVCGYMACEPRLSRLVLSGLPPVFKVNIRDDPAGQWLESSIRFSVADAGGERPGGEAVLAKLSEVLFVETLRRYVAQWPEGRTGWLAGARDPEVGRALALIHGKPAHPWTLADLAKESGISRSALAERFRHFLDRPPMGYLTTWRLQLGARILASTSSSVAQVASEVGYESEPAFNRAFKRAFGVPPARFRTQARLPKAPAAHRTTTVRSPAGAPGLSVASRRPARTR